MWGGGGGDRWLLLLLLRLLLLNFTALEQEKVISSVDSIRTRTHEITAINILSVTGSTEYFMSPIKKNDETRMSECVRVVQINSYIRQVSCKCGK